MSNNDIELTLAQEEELDMIKPLRHLMQQEADPEPSSEFLSVLPKQSHSILEEILHLSFMNIDQNGSSQKPISITLAIDASPGCGGIAWPAGQVLSNYLVKKGPDFVQGKSILELGSGTGLVGLVAGMLGGKVWITDQAPLLGIMRQNVIINKLDLAVTVSELNWGEPLPTDIPRPDLVLAADCVYFEPAFPLLVQTLSDLVDANTDVLFCYKKRRKADKRFFALLKKRFTWVQVADDPDGQTYNRETITILRLYRKLASQNPQQRS